MPSELRNRLADMDISELQGIIGFYQSFDAGLKTREEDARAIWEKVRTELPPSSSGVSFKSDVIVNAIATQLLIGKSPEKIEFEMLSLVTRQLEEHKRVSTFHSGFAEATAKSSSAGRAY